MELNEKTVEVLANTLKLEASVLKEQLTAQESKITDYINDKEVFLKSELEVLKSNINKDGYEKGKIAGREMELKDVKEKFGYKGIEGLKDYETLLNYVITDKTKALQSQPDEVVKQLKTEKELLQTNYLAKEQEVKALNEKFEQFKTNITITSKVEHALSSLAIDADDTIATAQKEMLKDQFLKSYSIQVIDGREYVVDSTGNKLVNKLGEPVNVSLLASSHLNTLR
jgi:phage-related minor tail protein